MFKKSEEIITSKEELSNYIEGIDVYNSLLLKELANPNIPKSKYVVSTKIFRPDLIAKDFYGDTNLQSIVILQCGSISNLKKGAVIELIPKEYLIRIINSL